MSNVELPMIEPQARIDLPEVLPVAAFAFRGYNITNQGRSAELLAHRAYGPTVEAALREAQETAAAALRRPVDLVTYVREQTPSSLDTFAEDVATIVAMEVAQIRLLHEFHGVEYSKAKMAYGYSLGEITALICGGVLEMRDALPPLLAMCGDCAELGRDASMGVVFSRAAELPAAEIHKLCLQITQEGQGLIGVSAQLSPNTYLILGQGDTVDRFKQRMGENLPAAHLRKNPHRWPPLHTPLLWDRCIPNRSGLLMLKMPCKYQAPVPRVLSMATGRFDYQAHNLRELVYRWIDHPQLLWDAVQHTLIDGVQVVVHVGPEPNLIPATFRRLSENVKDLLGNRWYGQLSLRAMATMVRPWIARNVFSRSSLLRAPFVRHVVLEDWLLERPVD